MPSQEPAGDDEWVSALTREQSVEVAPDEPLEAVGGPDRLGVFEASGRRFFSIESK